MICGIFILKNIMINGSGKVHSVAPRSFCGSRFGLSHSLCYHSSFVRWGEPIREDSCNPLGLFSASTSSVRLSFARLKNSPWGRRSPCTPFWSGFALPCGIGLAPDIFICASPTFSSLRIMDELYRRPLFNL